jgi:hypothetical protein
MRSGGLYSRLTERFGVMKWCDKKTASKRNFQVGSVTDAVSRCRKKNSRSSVVEELSGVVKEKEKSLYPRESV